jgi:hypothetical protein
MLGKLENFYLFIFEEKELIGKVWAEKSGNLFLMAWKKDANGSDVCRQINEACKS